MRNLIYGNLQNEIEALKDIYGSTQILNIISNKYGDMISYSRADEPEAIVLTGENV